MKKLFLPFIIGALLIGCTTNTSEVTETPKVVGEIGEQAMVVSAHILASQVGKEILVKGGNAVDAAIAVQFALSVVYPNAGNIGGGGFMVYRANDGAIETLDYRETAPSKAKRDMYLDNEGNVIEDLSTRGHLASGVPGSVDGMVEAHKKFGSLPWNELLQPSIDIAKSGFPISSKEATALNSIKETLLKNSSIEPAQFIKEWNEGDTIKHLALAKTLELIRDQGRAGFYEGETAKLIVEEMERGNGIISYEDLSGYHSIWRKPIIGTYRGYKIITMPPPSSGGIALSQLLQSVEDYDLATMGHNSADYIHLLTEAERRVYADRSEYLGDPAFYNVPVSQLTSSTYNKERMASFNPLKATPSDSIGHGSILLESDQTTHFSIIDAKGNAVSITTTLNGSYGSRVVVGNAGFLLNNEMDDFSVKPGFPNMYGLVGGEANAIIPGKRMLSSMTPTIIEKDGQLKLVVGSPGGSTIITSVFQTILNIIDFNMTMQEAVNAKRVHSQWKPDVIMHETDAISQETKALLEEKGHKFHDRGNIGRVDAVKVLEDGSLEGGADPRGEDKAAGY